MVDKRSFACFVNSLKEKDPLEGAGPPDYSLPPPGSSEELEDIVCA